MGVFSLVSPIKTISIHLRYLINIIFAEYDTTTGYTIYRERAFILAG